MLRNAAMTTTAMACALALGLAGGCGNAGGPKPPMGKVHGKVLYNGKPLTKGDVTFVPIQGKGGDSGQSASGPIESDGSFTLTTFNTGDGAIAGQHTAIVQVRATTASPTTNEPSAGKYVGQMPLSNSPEWKQAQKSAAAIPAKYTSVESSPLKFTVEAGKDNDFTLELKD